MATLINELEQVVRDGKVLALREDIIRIKLKEKLQLYVLDFIYNSKKYSHLIFYGGTCLRICFDLNRMSEDVNFETTELFDKQEFANQIRDYFVKNIQYRGFTTHVPGINISRVELRFPVLYELGLSEHERENLIIKVEVNQIQGAYPTEIKTIAKDRFSFVIRHYDLPTLMAGKMLACLERVWRKKGVSIKGRDYYDLIWYMQKGVMPNSERLANGIRKYTIKDAFEKISENVSKIKSKDLLMDLGALFENVEFIHRWVDIFQQEFVQLYQKYQFLK